MCVSYILFEFYILFVFLLKIYFFWRESVGKLMDRKYYYVEFPDCVFYFLKILFMIEIDLRVYPFVKFVINYL